MIDIIILFLQYKFNPDRNLYGIVSLTKFIHALLRSSLLILGGIFKGYIYSFSGAYILSPLSLMMQSGIILFCFLCIIIIIFLMTDWHAQENREALNLICLLSLWLFLMYFPAAYARVYLEFKGFISTDRYRYLPCIPAAGLAITAGVFLKNILARYALKPGILFAALFSIIIFSNFIEVRRKINKGLEHNRAFNKIAATYIEELKVLLHSQSGDVQILDDEFMNLITSKQNRGSGWNVRPSMLAYMYCTPNNLHRISFISPDKHHTKSTHLPLYSVKDGHIYRITQDNWIN
jgi:hypothetical protein